MQANTNCDRVLTDSIGRWHGIYAALGINVGDGRHCACPICGPGNNSHRFRMDDKEGRGTWICTHCNSGDGFSLIQKVLGVDFKEACLEVSKVIGYANQVNVNPEKKASPERLRELFTTSIPIKIGDPVTKYLKNRGLSDFPATLRYAPKCWEYETKKEQEAMLAVFSMADGEAVTIHRTFIKDGKKLDIEAPRKVMTPIKKMAGGSVRLYPQDGDTLGIAEGLETAIACHEVCKIPVWASLSATLMESFQPPVWAKKIEIFADRDTNYTGQKAAYILANRLFVKEHLFVNVSVAKNKDFLDDLVELIK